MSYQYGAHFVCLVKSDSHLFVSCRLLDGTVLVDLPRPSVLITDAYTILDRSDLCLLHVICVIVHTCEGCHMRDCAHV